MTKCNAHKCNKELNVEKREVHSLRIVSKQFKAKNGKTITIWEGWRFFCKDHHDLVKAGTLKADLELVYGKRKNRRHNKTKRRHTKKAKK